MPALNFKARFAPAVEAGEKTQTIRPERKRPIEVGDTLYLKTGSRTLGEARCIEVLPILISERGQICLDGQLLSIGERLELAVQDGFRSSVEFRWFVADQYGLPFGGTLIRWKLISSAAGPVSQAEG